MSDDISIPSPTYRVPRHRGMDPATRRLALIAAGIGGALVLIVGGWSMLGGGHHGVPVLEPQSGPVRVKPANPGGLQVQGVGNDIFSGGTDTSVDKLAPPPEVPDPQALRAPPPPPPATPAVHAMAEPASAPKQPVPAPAAAEHPARTVAAAHAPAKPAEARPPAQPAASRTVSQPAAARTVPQPATARSESQPAAARPVPQPAAAHDRAVAAARTGAGTARVQLAALSSEEAAKVEWRNLSRRVPGLLAGHQPIFSKVEHAGHVFWRVRAGGFADQAAARAFCQEARAKGLACTVADF